MQKQQKNKESIFNLIKSPYIRSFFAKYKYSYIFGLSFLVLINYLQTRIPIVIKNIIDGLEELNITIEILKTLLFSIGAIALFIGLGRVLWRIFIFGASRKIERDIRNDIFEHLEKLSQSYYSKHKTGEIMAYITNDLEALRNSMGPGILLITDVITLLALTLFNMFININVTLTIAVLIPLSLIAVITSSLGKIYFKRFTQKQEAFSNISDFMQENMSGIRVIKAFVQQEKEIEAFNEINNEYLKSNMKLMQFEAIMRPLMRTVAGIALTVAIGYGGYLTSAGIISIGSLIAFFEYLGMLVWPMIAIGMAVNNITRGSAALKRIESVLLEKVDITDAPNAKSIENFTGDIEVKNVSFTYPNTEKEVLKDISFSIKNGETLGIVGRTGSGKTTLVNLLLHLYNVKQNTVFISNEDINTIPLRNLRENIGYVGQDTFLFSDTIKNNIMFSSDDYSFDTVEEASKCACIHENIVDFKDGYDTMVGERGVTLSGGQKQRVSIARALIKDSQILILDDSLSAVDTDTEERILSNLKKRRKDKTNIIIAHRLSCVQHAASIIVLDEGKIIERGTHKELLSLNGLYNSLYQKQLLEKNINEEE